MCHSDIKPSNILIAKPGTGVTNFNTLANQSVSNGNKFQQLIKVINFGNLLNFKPDNFHKRQYYFAEYLSPE